MKVELVGGPKCGMRLIFPEEDDDANDIAFPSELGVPPNEVAKDIYGRTDRMIGDQVVFEYIGRKEPS